MVGVHRRGLRFRRGLGGQFCRRLGNGRLGQVQPDRRGLHRVQLQRLPAAGVVVGRRGGVLLGFPAGVQKHLGHVLQVVRQLGAAGVHVGDLRFQAVQPQLVDVLDLVGLGRGGVHQLLGLLAGLLAGRAGNGPGVGLRLAGGAVGLGAGFVHNAFGLGVGLVQQALALGVKAALFLVQGAALYGQRGAGLFGVLLQALVLPRQVGVFQRQDGVLVGQRAVFVPQAGHLAAQLLALAGVIVAAAGQRHVLVGQQAVARGQGLAVLFQPGVFLLQLLGPVLCAGQALFILAAQGQHGLTHVVRFQPAKARFADAALFNECRNIDVSHCPAVLFRRRRKPRAHEILFTLNTYYSRRRGTNQYGQNGKRPHAGDVRALFGYGKGENRGSRRGGRGSGAAGARWAGGPAPAARWERQGFRPRPAACGAGRAEDAMGRLPRGSRVKAGKRRGIYVAGRWGRSRRGRRRT